ncbi:MAG TPA: asparaginase, partial [Anaerolineaceae bacterium]|nr:asparaginase [Anaerolineaceae bacterium]
MQKCDFSELVEVTRGPAVESIHLGAVAVVDAAGRLVAQAGNPQVVTYLRSSSKPIQALPFVEAGGLEAFGITDRELALLCASHSGTDEHVAVVRGIQQKIGVTEDRLLCGTHRPYYTPTYEAMLLRGEPLSPNRHNCSGKHTGFLAYALLRGEPLDEYIAFDHPIQTTILETFAQMSGLPAGQIHTGIDGCSAPVFAVPLYNAAWAFARLADPAALPELRAA